VHSWVNLAIFVMNFCYFENDKILYKCIKLYKHIIVSVVLPHYSLSKTECKKSSSFDRIINLLLISKVVIQYHQLLEND